MNNKTLFCGLLVVGGIFAYYAWKQHSLSTEETSETPSSTPTTSSTGSFVDDVPVNPSLLGITTSSSTPTSFLNKVKSAVSQVVEPFSSSTKQTQSTGQGQFADS